MMFDANDLIEDDSLTPAEKRIALAGSVLLAWESAVLSEGQAATLLGIDRIDLRLTREHYVRTALVAWRKYRQAHPAEGT